MSVMLRVKLKCLLFNVLVCRRKIVLFAVCRFRAVMLILIWNLVRVMLKFRNNRVSVTVILLIRNRRRLCKLGRLVALVLLNRRVMLRCLVLKMLVVLISVVLITILLFSLTPLLSLLVNLSVGLIPIRMIKASRVRGKLNRLLIILNALGPRVGRRLAMFTVLVRRCGVRRNWRLNVL